VGAFYQTLDERATELALTQDLSFLTQALFGKTVTQALGSPLLPGGVSYIGKDTSHDTQKAVFGQLDIRLLDKLDPHDGGFADIWSIQVRCGRRIGEVVIHPYRNLRAAEVVLQLQMQAGIGCR